MKPPSTPPPHLENPHHIPLSAEAIEILQTLFAGYTRLTIQAELGSGFSGGRLLQVSPVREEAIAELPAVVKVAPTPLILQEWRAFETCIRHQLPDVAEIQGEPVYVNGWGGLRYPLVGGGVFQMESFLHYGRHASTEDICHVLQEQLLRSLGPWWRANDFAPAFHLGASYDRLLPVQAWLRQITTDEPPAFQIPSDAAAWPSLKTGETVRLTGFVVREVDEKKQTITVDCTPPTGFPVSSCRLRVHLLTSPTYHVNQVIEVLDGVVVKTRWEYLHEQAQTALGPTIDLTAKTIPAFDGTRLPNPLHNLPQVLADVRHVKLAHIHGDLNLENILVNPISRTVRLIDFAEARRDHVLHDLLRLETGIITRLLPPLLTEIESPAETVITLYRQLHEATRTPDRMTAGKPSPSLKKFLAILLPVRRMAAELLYDPQDWAEYYHGLTVYLLGALKFNNLDNQAKQGAFWGAAMAQSLASNPPAAPRSLTPSRWPVAWKIAFVLILGLVMLGGILWFVRNSAFSQEPGEHVAVMTDFTPVIEVRQSDNSRLSPALRGKELYRDDVVITYEEGQAYIICLQKGLLFLIPPENTFRVTCKEDPNDPRLVGKFALHVPLSVTATTTPTIISESDRGTRADLAKIPLLLSPRNTFVTEIRPTFRWQPVEGASGYQISLSMPGGKTWSVETGNTNLPYPEYEPALMPGSSNIVTVVALGIDSQVDKSLLQVLDKNSLNLLAEDETTIRNLGLDPTSQAYLLAQLYGQYGLVDTAVTQLETLTQTPDLVAAAIWQQLGDLYLMRGLYTEAETHYQTAWTAAESEADLNAQAAAAVGLARVDYAFREPDQAILHWQQAEDLYRQAGNTGQAEWVAGERERLEE